MNYLDFFTEKESAALYRELLETGRRAEVLMDIKNYMEDRLETRFNGAIVYLYGHWKEKHNPCLENNLCLLFTSNKADQPQICVELMK